MISDISICQINNFNFDQYHKLQQQCIKQGHLSEKNNLLDVINNDINYIASKKISIEQINDILEKINMHYIFNGNCVKVSDKKSILKKINYNDNWVIRYFDSKQLFGGTITAYKISYNGSENCPFSMYCNCTEEQKKSYTLGDSDYVLINNINKRELIFSSLLIHQIKCHNFFQDNYSTYRLEPNDIINFFDIKQNISYKTLYNYIPKFDYYLTGLDKNLIDNNQIIEDTDTYTLAHNNYNSWYFFSKDNFHPYEYKLDDFSKYSLYLNLNGYSLKFHPGCRTEGSTTIIFVCEHEYLLDSVEKNFSLY